MQTVSLRRGQTLLESEFALVEREEDLRLVRRKRFGLDE
jgi:hypothetical protein